jgi:hypothetical protein
MMPKLLWRACLLLSYDNACMYARMGANKGAACWRGRKRTSGEASLDRLLDRLDKLCMWMLSRSTERRDGLARIGEPKLSEVGIPGDKDPAVLDPRDGDARMLTCGLCMCDRTTVLFVPVRAWGIVIRMPTETIILSCI